MDFQSYVCLLRAMYNEVQRILMVITRIQHFYDHHLGINHVMKKNAALFLQQVPLRILVSSCEK